ncbi:CapA family protein [Nocardioides sp.]|uniref:CapA family protein n=1 Tax=Nocardioides sp. TaxID=35761 RepID=UPI002ED2168F
MRRTRVSRAVVALCAVLVVAGCTEPTAPPAAVPDPADEETSAVATPGDARPITLAFAGDSHFEFHLTDLFDNPDNGLGPINRVLSDADVTVLNLETAITTRGTPEPKELEVPDNRYHFRTAPAALDVLAAAGVDAVSMANNHGADYGPVGMRDTLRAKDESPIAVLGVGRNRREAFAPYRVDVRGTEIAVVAADASPREGASTLWGATAEDPGTAAAREPRPEVLLDRVRRLSRTADVVVVFLHWGREYDVCATVDQQTTARALSRAGADVIVGSHTHRLLGSGWQPDGSYVNYGLGNFVWYHDLAPETGVLKLSLENGEVVSDEWIPALIQPDGRPKPLAGSAAKRATAQWRAARACADVAPAPGEAPVRFRSSIRPVDAELRERMAPSHRDRCPLDHRDLRYLRMSHVGFDGRVHQGEMVVAASQADTVVGIFRRLFHAGYPIRRMRLVSDYGGNDDRSMAANNTSAYNCRPVAGTRRWSDHAYGTAVDINPVQNPYLRPTGSIAPRAGRAYARLDRSVDAEPPWGVIHDGDVVIQAFNDAGWAWGGFWADPDYQHFTAGS